MIYNEHHRGVLYISSGVVQCRAAPHEVSPQHELAVIDSQRMGAGEDLMQVLYEEEAVLAMQPQTIYQQHLLHNTND